MGFSPGRRSSTCTLSCVLFDRLKEIARCGLRHHVPERAFLTEVIECGYHDDRAVAVGLAYILELRCNQLWDGLRFRIIVELAVRAVSEIENEEAVAGAKIVVCAPPSVRCKHGMTGTDSAAVVCDSTVEYVAQVRCWDDHGVTVAIGACRVATLGANAVAEEGIHTALVEADAVVENRKNVLCVFRQRILDRSDNEFRLPWQLPTHYFLVCFDCAFERFPVAADSGDSGGMLPREPEAYEGSPVRWLRGRHRGRFG